MRTKASVSLPFTSTAPLRPLHRNLEADSRPPRSRCTAFARVAPASNQRNETSKRIRAIQEIAVFLNKASVNLTATRAERSAARGAESGWNSQ